MQNKDTNEMKRIPEITIEELQTALNRIKAEDIKACDEETKEMVRQIFNEILKQNEFTPVAWRKVRIKVIHKKRRRGRCWKLPPDLFFACVVHTVYDSAVQQILPKT